MFELMKLPYGKEDLAPYMSSNTLDFHHGLPSWQTLKCLCNNS